MNEHDVVLKRLQLRTPPFAPQLADDGTAFDNDPFEDELMPQADTRLIKYYYDLYDWSASQLVGGLSPDAGLKTFPPAKAAQKPLLVLASGTTRSGSSSLVNLLVHRIRQTNGLDPILVQTELFSADQPAAVKGIARLFIAAYTDPGPVRDNLTAMYEGETKDAQPKAPAYYTALFQAMSQDVRKATKRPVVVLVSGVENYDLWSCIYNSTSPLANYIIVRTPSYASARTCHQSMQGHRVAHIHAQPLDVAAARAYVRQRLRSERPPDAGAVDDLRPFSDDALDVLFERTAAASRQQKAVPVRKPIGWLRETVNKVLQRHIDALARKVAEDGEKALDHLSPAELTIGREAVLSVRHEMNAGGDA